MTHAGWDSRKMFRNPDEKTNDPCDTTGPVDPEPRSRPSSSGADVIGRHGAAYRAEGGGHETEESHEIIGNTCDGEEDAYRESSECGDRSRDLGQHGAEAVRCDER